MTAAHVVRTALVCLAVVAMFAVVAALLIACGRGPGPCHPAVGIGGDSSGKRCEVRR